MILILIVLGVLAQAQIIELTTEYNPRIALKDYEFSVVLFTDGSEAGQEMRRLFFFANKLYKEHNLSTRSVAWA